MGYFTVRYDSRVVIYDRKMSIRLAPDNDYLPPATPLALISGKNCLNFGSREFSLICNALTFCHPMNFVAFANGPAVPLHPKDRAHNVRN